MVIPTRIPTGITGFDEIIQGGLLKNRVYLLSGPPGCGKTTFCVQFLAKGAMNNEPGLYVSLTESIENIVSDMSNYNFQINELIKLQRLEFIDIGPQMGYGQILSPIPTPIVLFEHIIKHVKENNIQRLVIDSVSAVNLCSEDMKQNDRELNRFIRNLMKLGCTTVLISELTNPNSYIAEQFAAHGVFFLHHFLDNNTKSMIRAIQVVKMRGTKHDSNMKKLAFSDDGLTVENISVI
ncbi:MAG TPA: ATPase domain-containing protein [archaeon]|nr:ATPase domain-containing protein [archaeon]